MKSGKMNKWQWTTTSCGNERRPWTKTIVNSSNSGNNFPNYLYGIHLKKLLY